MRTGYASLFSVPLALTLPASSHFLLKDNFVGDGFLQAWKWETMDDPTHGRVNYINQTSALQRNLTFANNHKFVMRADSDTVVPSQSRGRDSIRITSYEAYDDAIFILDLQHMPEGCSTWPAFWSLSKAGPWPHGGEIDIIEGVNLNTQNLASLHTTPSCTMPQWRDQTGSSTSLDCNTAVNYNQGCGVSFSDSASFGTSYNAIGGGFWAMQKTRARGVQVWFWRRDDPNMPSEIRSGSGVLAPINPGWGRPAATFGCESCDYDQHFNAHQLVFDLTFCGDWAGSVWPNSGCGPSTCEDFVNNNPKAFENAYWEINALRVYTPDEPSLR
ncbi:hypothetical protein DENSPDRAFT_837832 [Dentipellis sp. KUC8613]|nr:hypothetical protein DENSPDRAFT_837832 [Dentipellis sp. KUC8613]